MHRFAHSLSKTQPGTLFFVVALAGLLGGCSSSDGTPGTGGAGGTGGQGGAAGVGGASGMGGGGGMAGASGMGGGGGATSKRIFITNTTQDADFGGTDGADALCAEQATAAGLEGEFRSWLSTVDSAVEDRLNRSTVPYVLVDGTTIANDWDDLVDGTIMARIDLDASGLRRVGDVWTGTRASGASYSPDDCAGFTTSSSEQRGLCGASASTLSEWTENITPQCSTPLRLYCIEQ